MKISSWPRILSWPTYSASDPGRSERSICSSCTEEGLAEIKRSVSTATSGFCQSLQGGADALGHREPLRQALDRRERLFLAVTQAHERVHHVARRARRRLHCDLRNLALQLQQQALGRLLADARHLGEAHGVLHRHRVAELGHR